ncbi:MAG: hypothetical protein IIB69_07005 [Proteobacteria bacterium]|nr:hypothetical protein [Pseudomonadota bacterium]
MIWLGAGDLAYPSLVLYQAEQDYRQHFAQVYCRGTIKTFDGIEVRFRRQQFGHCFFESVNSKDDTFSPQRAERIDWIKAALQDSNAELRLGWDNKKKRAANDRRVVIVVGDYVVIIRIYGEKKAEFVTAFVAGQRTIKQIRTNPIWT